MWCSDWDRFLLWEVARPDLGLVANALFSCSSRASSKAVDLFHQCIFLCVQCTLTHLVGTLPTRFLLLRLVQLCPIHLVFGRVNTITVLRSPHGIPGI